MPCSRLCLAASFGERSDSLLADGQRVIAGQAAVAVRIIGAHWREERNHLYHRARVSGMHLLQPVCCYPNWLCQGGDLRRWE